MSGRASSRAGNRDELLPLKLPVAPRLRAFIAPEMATPCDSTFDSDDWRFGVDWDGARALLIADSAGKVVLLDEMARDISALYPEITTAGLALGGHAVTLDGVVAVLDRDGKPNLELFAKRTAGSSKLAAAFLAADLLQLEGRSMLRKSLDERWNKLGDVLLPDDHIQCPDDVIGEGSALAMAAEQRGLVALIARRRKSPYNPGLASGDRLRIQLSPRANLVVTAIEKSRRLEDERRFVFAQNLAGHLTEVGSVVNRLDAATLGWIETAEPLTATVDYTSRRGAELEGIRLVALRNDLDPGWCQWREPVAAPRDSEKVSEFGFRPTVIPALPIPD